MTSMIMWVRRYGMDKYLHTFYGSVITYAYPYFNSGFSNLFETCTDKLRGVYRH